MCLIIFFLLFLRTNSHNGVKANLFLIEKIIRGVFRACQTSKMELITKVAQCFQILTILAENSSLDVEIGSNYAF